MTADKVREAMHAAPFFPFTLHMADGRSHLVPHPDFIAITGPGNYVTINNLDDDSTAFVDVGLITQLVISPLHAKNDQ